MDPEKYQRLQDCLRSHTPLVIAYSGGVDSACLLAVSHATLGDDVIGVIADSSSLPRKALADALALAEQIGVAVEVVKTTEMEDENYASNPINRCYFCKSELFAKLDELARSRGYSAIAYGENADDANHFRPGRQAAAEFSIIAPLKHAGLTKADVREISRGLGLPTADAPAQPCLSSRIPHGTPVTTEALAMIERGEEFVRGLGFKVFRVRHIVDGGDAAQPGRARARVQIAPEEMGALDSCREQIHSGLAAAGYSEVEIDPAGYQSPA